MSVQSVTRTTCDRCGGIWEGRQQGEVQLIIQDREKPLLGVLAYHIGYYIPTWAHLCGSCASGLLPWLNINDPG